MYLGEMPTSNRDVASNSLNASRIPASLSCAVVGGDYCALATPHHDCGGVRASGFPPQLNHFYFHRFCVDVAEIAIIEKT